MSSEHIQQLQLLQQNLEALQAQKQQLESQVVELDSALKEITSTDKAYKIVGKIMIATDKEQTQKELQEQKEVINLRLKSITQQEEQLQKKIEEAQQKMMQGLEDDKSTSSGSN